VSRSLIVMRDDSAKPIVDAINGATKSLRIRKFLFSDPSILKAVIDAQRRGVKVRVMLNPARRDGESENAESNKKLVAAGVEVIDSNPEYNVTHEKSMVVDDTTAFVNSLNLTGPGHQKRNWPSNSTDREDHRP
jgi:cardiolipin synthase A/B